MIAAFLAILAWLAVGMENLSIWFPFSLLCISSYIVVEMNNKNTLLRKRSRMMSATFLFLETMNMQFIADPKVSSVILCMTMFMFISSSLCQVFDAVGSVFYAFFFVGVAGIIFPNSLFFVPIVFFLTIRPLYVMSARTVSAAILGLIFPYWLGAIYVVLTEDMSAIISRIDSLFPMRIFLDYTCVTLGMVASFALILISFLIAMVDFLTNAFKDKIRVRLIYYFFIVLSLAFVAAIAVMPTFVNYLLPLFTLAASPVIAHYFTLNTSKVTNYIFMVWIVLVLMLTLFPICLTSLYNTVLMECL